MAETMVQEHGPDLPVTEETAPEMTAESQASTAPAAMVTTLPMEPFGFLVAAIILNFAGVACQSIALIGEPDELKDLRNLLLVLAAEIAWMVFHYQAWSMIPHPYARTTPFNPNFPDDTCGGVY
mgnify:FL=1